ncbi:MAG: PH domain-containing protein, partial [Actinomycetota bacterium]|nr:PH domain-containing protein [Actinomycetota bacterium]
MTSDAPRRLHHGAVVIDALRSTMQLFAGVVLVAVVRGTPPGLAFLLALASIAVGLGLGYARWRRTTYWLEDGALHLRSGVFTPDEKIVPRARVQSVDTAIGPLQRLFGVVEVRVQVPGAADEDEIVLAAVTQEEAARLRLALGQPAPAAPDERVVLGMRNLLLAALTGPQISVAVSAVAGIYALLHNVVDVQKDGEGLLSQLDSPGAVAAAAAALLAAAYILSFLAAIVVFAGFEVQRDAQVLRIRSGLLVRRVISIPLERIDGVVIVEGLARGPLGLAALRLESAAHGGEQARGRTLLPLARRSEAEAVIARLVPDLA